jgi:hypothetical protein
VILSDPINIRYATGTRNMQVFSQRNWNIPDDRRPLPQPDFQCWPAGIAIQKEHNPSGQ